jgi:PAS domain S-box-containing protein
MKEGLKVEDLKTFKFISDNANDAYFLIDRDANFLYVNKTASRLFGYSEDELLTMRVPDVDMIYDLSRYQAVFDMACDKSVAPVDTIAKKKNGSTFPAEITVTAHEIDGEPYMFASLRDISTRKRMEQELIEKRNLLENLVKERTAELTKVNELLLSEIAERRKAEEEIEAERKWFIDTVNTLPDLFFALGLDFEILKWNRALESVTGYTEKEVSKMSAIDFFAGEDSEKVAHEIEKTIKYGINSADFDIVTKDKRVIPYSFTAAALKDRMGDLIGITGIGRDITDRRKTEKALREAAVYMDAMGDALIVLNMQREVIRLNRAATILLGYTEEELRGMSFENIFPEREHRKHYEEMEMAVKTGTVRPVETVVVTKQGEEVTVMLSGTVMKDDSGEPAGFVGVCRNIAK